MLVEGGAGSGKTTLVEEIATIYISEGKDQGGYAIATNGCQTLTEQRLFTYRNAHGTMYRGPLQRIIDDAKKHQDRRYVFILHEWNRVTEFMSLMGNLYERELGAYGPDSWLEPEDIPRKRRRHGFEDQKGDHFAFPENVRIILTGNPAEDEYAGETTNFMEDGALGLNRLLSAKVDFGEDENGKKVQFSLGRQEQKESEVPSRDAREKIRQNEFPCGVMVDNLIRRLGLPEDAISDSLLNNRRGTEADALRKICELIDDRINPGKIVAEVRRLFGTSIDRRNRAHSLKSEIQDAINEKIAGKVMKLLDSHCNKYEKLPKPEMRDKTLLISAIETCELADTEFEAVPLKLIELGWEDVHHIAGPPNAPFTAMSRAISAGSPRIVVALLKKGVTPDEALISLAKEKNNTDILELLRSARPLTNGD